MPSHDILDAFDVLGLKYCCDDIQAEQAYIQLVRGSYRNNEGREDGSDFDQVRRASLFIMTQDPSIYPPGKVSNDKRTILDA